MEKGAAELVKLISVIEDHIGTGAVSGIFVYSYIDNEGLHNGSIVQDHVDKELVRDQSSKSGYLGGV